MNGKVVSKPRTILVFILTILLGFILFALPNLFFGITKLNGGLTGINLLLIAIFQIVTVSGLLYFSLRLLGKNFQFIGLSGAKWKTDCILGLLVGLTWAILQFGWIIPATGGKERADILQVLALLDGTFLGTFSFIILGVIGGGVTEELFNRGYFIQVLKDTFNNPTIGLWVAALLSILFFAIGHLPTDAISWFDIVVPTLAYTLLFLLTQRLTAPMVAHGTYNLITILLIYHLYYN
jgi:membrane protease YdiL (CAAX protease family)